MRRLTCTSVTAAVVVVAATGSVLGATLTEITPLGTDTTSEARAMTPDGKYVVGDSGTGLGFIWDEVNGTRQIHAIAPSISSILSTARGVAYRTIIVEDEPVQQLVVQGLGAGWHINAFSADGGLTWPSAIRQVNWPSESAGPAMPLYNSMSGSSTDFFYDTCWRTDGANNERTVYLMRGQGDPPVINNPEGFVFGPNAAPWDTKNQPAGANTVMRGISDTGRAIGFRRNPDTGQRLNHIFEYAGTGAPVNYFFTGLDGTTAGEAWAINADGSRVFGYSPVSGRSGNWPYVVLNLVNSGGQNGTTPSTVYELPTYPDVAGSTTNAVPYGASADGNWAVGHNYRGQERAVLWDVRGDEQANWKVYDLTAYFGALGQLGPFTRLERAFSVAVDAENEEVVASGRGFTAAGTRGFVARIPLSAFPLPDTGACCMIGSCTSRFEADCPEITGQQSYAVNTLCINAGCPGACCNDNGTCSDFVSSGDCALADGIFRGSSSACAQGACEGACCLGFKVCEQVAYGLPCDGRFAGIGVSCEAAQCECNEGNRIWADADYDGDVDHDDFAVFQTCYTGPGGGVPPGCECLERDGLDDISGVDFEAFKDCVTGPGVPYDINNLPPGCTP